MSAEGEWFLLRIIIPMLSFYVELFSCPNVFCWVLQMALLAFVAEADGAGFTFARSYIGMAHLSSQGSRSGLPHL